MYHGMVAKGRGVETMLDLLEINHHINAVILGDGEEDYVDALKKAAKTRYVDNRMLFLDAVSQDVLWQYVGAVDVGLILAPAISRNHEYSLPNKLFENIQSETPVICPHYVEMKRIVEEYGIGLNCDPERPEEISKCIERLRTDTMLYESIRNNVKQTKEILCWEEEKKELKEAYRSIMMRGIGK